MSDNPAIKLHVFGGHSDLCLYCGCGLGWWWSSNRGNVCPARIEADILMPKITTPTYVAQTGPANYWAFAGGATIEEEPEVKVKIRPLKLETGRKFR